MLGEKIKSYLDSHYEEMLELIEKLVNIDSGSSCKKGIDEVCSIMAEEYRKLGFAIEVLEHETLGNSLITRKKGVKNNLLLICHLDTAFPEGSAKKNRFHIKDNIATGPGVEDMKSCLVSCLYALKSLLELEISMLPNITVLMSGDEESGSNSVKKNIIEEGKKSTWCIVTEGARENGAIVIERKGNAYVHVKTFGRAVHAGIEPEKGRNAIEELALKIVKLRELTNYEIGTTVTIGTISGGENRIVVAESAEMDIDLRYRTKKEGERLIQKVEGILKTTEIDGVKTEYTLTVNRPPLVQVEGSDRLQRLVEEAGNELGIPYITAITGGVSDGNFVADLGVPTIDGLGPVGGMMCSPEEYLILDSLTERTSRMALVIARLNG